LALVPTPKSLYVIVLPFCFACPIVD